MERLVYVISFHPQKITLNLVSLTHKYVAETNKRENLLFLAPKQTRPCVCLAWHEFDTNLLAIGHDRNRSDHCITVWDTERGLPKDKAVLNLIGLSETAHSICWDKQYKLLVAGMSHKYIKLMDLRRKYFSKV